MKYYILPLLLIVSLISNAAFATTYTFNSNELSSKNKTKITSMANTTNVVWNLQQTIAPDEVITGAVLTLKSLYTQKNNYADTLYVHLLNSSSGDNSLVTSSDKRNTADFFANQGDLLAAPNGGTYFRNHASNLVINFTGQELINLQTYITDGYFAFAFDPDSRWYDKGMTFSFTTSAVPVFEPSTMMLVQEQDITTPVPEPGTMLLLGVGLLGITIYGKRRFNYKA